MSSVPKSLSLAAALLGRRGGAARSKVKKRAARANGRKGGRPSFVTKMESRCRHYPGWEIVASGLRDLSRRMVTPSACVVSLAAARLKRGGLSLPAKRIRSADTKLYQLMEREHGSGLAHARYNSFIGALSSFANALDRWPA